MSDTVDQVRNAFKEYKICVIVPTYNNASVLPAVLRDVLRFTDDIIVVNDGAIDDTEKVLQEFSVVKIGYETNRGKGFAIRTGFKKAIELGYCYAITIDSDGQHFADDLIAFTNALPLHTNAIIIGARNMDQSSVPGKSSFGNKFSNFWFWFETGIRMPDTQSGYRLYPLNALKEISFFTRKYEFEIEVLVRSAWRDVEVTSVPVKVFYPEKEKRISHFRPFKDFSRISVLNTVLVTITLLYIKPRDFFRSFRNRNFFDALKENLFSSEQSNSLKAASVGFGVFMGIVPIWGFQLITAIALALLLRLNKTLVIIAANISIPPFIPFILYGSLVTGSFWMGDKAISLPDAKNITLDFIHNSLTQYIAGSITLASSGRSERLGMITYLILQLAGRKPDRK